MARDTAVIDYRRIYDSQPDAYDALVSAEDARGALLERLRELAPLEGAPVIEVGAGTGRLTRAVVNAGATVRATDASAAMIEVARRRLAGYDPDRWSLDVADARIASFEPGWADLALAGWVFGHFTEWHPTTWRDEIDASIERLNRGLRPGATLVIIETLGTGTPTPAAPSACMATYYEWLELERGFTRLVVPTDYRFSSAREGEALTRFFFGDAIAALVARRRDGTLPEWTGVWYRHVPNSAAPSPGLSPSG